VPITRSGRLSDVAEPVFAPRLLVTAETTSMRSSSLEPYSHSIINERSMLLIGRALDAASQIFAVIFTVNLSGTSIGAGFGGIFAKTHLSRSIDIYRLPRPRTASPTPSTPVRGAQGNAEEALASNALSCCPD
jgi:hypothetical protein